MNFKLAISIVAFTIIVSSIFVVFNPNIATDFKEDYTDGEVFIPVNDSYDFSTFRINNSQTQNFTAKIISNGHINLCDDTGERSINIIELDKLLKSQKDSKMSFLDDELKKTGWTVDGVIVHQIDFPRGGRLYSAYYKNSDTNTIIYIATPNEQETADMMNSLRFD